MFCSKCGNKLPDDAKFCPKCGNKVSGNSEIKEKIVDVTEKVVDEITETVDSVSKEVNSFTEDVTSGFNDAKEKANEKINEANESIKNFKFSDLLTKKYVDLGSVITSLAPVVLLIFFFVINVAVFGLLFNLIFSILNTIPFGVGTVYDVLFFIEDLIAGLVGVIAYVALAVAVASFGLLIYRVVVYNETDTINIFQLISCLIAIVALLGFVIAKVYWLRWFGIISFIFGVDFLIINSIKKEEIHGNLDLVGDINTVKAKFNESKANKDAEKKAQQEVVQEVVDEQSQPINNISADPNGTSTFDGTGGELFLNYILLVLLTIISCGLLTPFMLVKITKWEKEHTIINGQRLMFNGTTAQLWGLWIKWWFLSLITCGIYSYFATVDYFKWKAKHTAYVGTLESNGIYPDSLFDGNSFEYLGYSILTGIVTGITCGIAKAWMDCIINKWIFKSTVVNKQRLKFDCTGGQLFGTYLIVGILDIITCGLYSPWGECKINKLIYSHVHVEK